MVDVLDWYAVRAIAGLLAFITAVFIGIPVVVVHFAESIDKTTCHHETTALNRPTRFVRYSYWSWDCLTPDNKGHWISVDNLRAVNGG